MKQEQGMPGGGKDIMGGVLMLVLGLGAITMGLGYQVGTLTRMGPGYFPVAVGAVLAAMGAIILLGGLRAQAQHRREAAAGAALPQAKRQAPEWRGWSAIVLGSIAFIVLGHYGGLVPATFAVVFISALGDRQNTVRSALLLALAMVVVCVIIFSWALQLQFPMFRWG